MASWKLYLLHSNIFDSLNFVSVLKRDLFVTFKSFYISHISSETITNIALHSVPCIFPPSALQY